MIELTQQRYNKIYNFFKKNNTYYRLLYFVYKVFPIIIALGYALIVVLAFLGQAQYRRVLLTIPAITFYTVSAIRKNFDKPRPYEVLKINSLIHKDTTGKSFPSRHCASAFVISFSILAYVNFWIGLAFVMLSICVAISRVLAGVHFVRDVVFGSIFGIIMVLVGLFIM